MTEAYDFMTNEQEKKEIQFNQLWKQAQEEVLATFWEDLTADEYREALNECGDNILKVQKCLINTNSSELRMVIKQIVFDHWFDNKTNECYEKLQAKGE